MGSPYLNTNESIVLSTHNVLINTIPAEAILTNQRLILVDTRHTRLHPQDIPFAAVETVTIGDTSAMEPVLSLSIVLPDETRHMLGIVFTQAPKSRRTGERDEWAVKLKEASLAAREGQGTVRAELVPPWIPGALPEEMEPGSEPDFTEDKFRNPPLVPKKPRAAPGSRKTLYAAGAIVIIAIVIIAGVFVIGPSLTGRQILPALKPTPAPTPVATATPAPTEQPTPEATVVATPEETPVPVMTPTAAPQALVPQSGVWVRINYPGSYAASYGTSGRLRDITGSGDKFYQIPAKNEIVEASVQKLDESGTVLTVTFYNDGQAVASRSISNPHGTLDLHADLRTAAAPAVTTPSG